MTIGPIEPSADQRAGAKQLRGTFLALVAEGFTEAQAITLVGHLLTAATGGES